MKSWSLVLALGALGALGACASTSSELGTAAPAQSHRSAQVYYLAGESAYADGNYPQASALWKRAILEMPRRAAYDGLRHKVLLRVGHGQLMAFAATGDHAYLDEGIAMLEAYVDKHVVLLGEEQDALDQREQVYELVGEMEVARAAGHGPERPPQMVVDGDETERAFVDPHAGETLDEDGMVREVRVRGIEQPDVNDPIARAKLVSAFANDQQAGVLTRAGSFRYEPRALVRLFREPAALGGDPAVASKVGRSVTSVGRDVLQACYADHLAKAGELSDVEVHVTVAMDGSVTESSFSGLGLGDAEADLCVLEALRTVQLAAYDAGEVSVSLSLSFFLDTPRPIFEAAVQPFDPTKSNPDPVNTMPATTMESDRSH